MNFQPLQTVPDSQAKQILIEEEDHGVDPIRFTKVEDYTTFDAEYAFVGNDIVLHFFLPEDRSNQQADLAYWKSRFPEALDRIATDYWGASYPRLQAAFTAELNSWWLRCFGFAQIGDPEARVRKFLEKLDAGIEG